MQLEEQTGSSPDAQAQEPSGAEGGAKAGDTEDSLLSVVQSVVEKSTAESATESEPDSPPEGQSKDVTTEQKAQEQEPSLDDDKDYSQLPIWKHKEFRGVVDERNYFKRIAKANKDDADQFRQIQTFMETNQLTAEEVAEGLALMAQMKVGDPAKAYEALASKAELLATAAGKKLPAELEEKVEQGYLDRETAQSMHQQQMAVKREAELAKAELARRSQQDQRGQVQAMANAVAAWERVTKESDPDFDLKAELVKDRVRAHVAAHGVPKSPDEALKVSKDAYDAVTQTLLRVRGDKTPMRPAVGGKTNGSAAPEPKNLLDVIRRAAAGA